MRTIGVVTAARSDYGIYLPILRKITSDPELGLHIIATGMHLAPEFGLTVQVIEQDGFEINDRVEMLLSSDTPEGIAKSMGLGTIGFAQAYTRLRPDILLVVGDRFEMHAAVVASLPFNIPVAHIHGGESTEGLIDEPIRHSITKMSHMHFVSTGLYSRRVIQMGEEPWRVTVSGAPSLDHIRELDVLSLQELNEQLEIEITGPTLLVTYHPVTLEYEQTETHVRELLAALEEIDHPVVFTYPNSDTSGRLIIKMIHDFGNRHERATVAVNLGTQAYLSLMSHVTAMVGNSSSGIIEAASFKLPVVNIGSRQRGRIHDRNVINVGYNRDAILDGITKAISSEFQNSLQDLVNPYGDGQAAGKIVDRLKEVQIDLRMLQKSFHDSDGDGIE